ncbi:MAG: GntR family transcriptional regulator [Thalassovita sp.]
MPATNKLIQKPKVLSEVAAEFIREAIVSGEFCLGDALTEVKLSEMFGISSTPVREAITILKREGMIQGESQKVARVFTLSAQQLTQLCRYRFALETSAIDFAMTHDPAGLVARLEALNVEMRHSMEVSDYETYLQLDRAFHDALFDHAGNAFLKEGYRCVANRVATLRTYLSRAPLRVQKSFDEHVKITAALKEGRLEDAKATLWTQIDRGTDAEDELRLEIARARKANGQ